MHLIKPLRTSQILKSESLVGKVQAVLENKYLNPFHTALDQRKLYNLSSGSPLETNLQRQFQK